MSKSDLCRVPLIDGLPADAGGKPILYKLANLRETSVADERWATEQAERVMLVDGQHKLLVSDATYRFALTARHIEAFECDGQRITQAMLGDGWLDVVGKLSSHDLGLIEHQVFLLTMAAEVRYGHITQAEFDRLVGGGSASEGAAPQPVGQAAGVGPDAGHDQPGPALLADYAGDDAAGPAAPARG